MTTILQRSMRQQSASSQGMTTLLTAVAYFVMTLDAQVVVTTLPSIHRALGVASRTLQWTVSAYTIAFGAGSVLTASAIGDRLGRCRVYVVGWALFTAARPRTRLRPRPRS